MSNNNPPSSRAPSAYSSKTTMSKASTSTSTTTSSSNLPHNNNNNNNTVIKREPSTADLLLLEHEDEEELPQQQQLNAPNTVGQQQLNVPDNYCITCNRTFATAVGLKCHNTKLHNPDPNKQMRGEFQCSQCPYRNEKAANLANHMRIAHPTVKEKQPKKITRAKSIGAKEKPPAKIIATRAKSIGAKKQPTRAMPKPTDQQQQPGTSAAAYAPQQRQQVKKRGSRRARDHAEDDDEDDELELIPPSPEKKPAGRPRQLIPRNQGAIDSGSNASRAGSSSAVASNYAGMVINACAQSNLVTFHDVDLEHNRIGQITFRFHCNQCRGERGVARCSRGRPYCVVCCGHAECN